MRAVACFLAAAVSTFPAPHHGVLQKGQLIEIFIGIVQRALNERGVNLCFSELNRFADDILPLIARHARHQKLAPANCFGEAMKARAVADEVRPHCHDNVDRQLRRSRRRQKQPNDCRRFVATLGSRRGIEATLGTQIRESKQLLELIDEQQNPADLGLPQRRNLRQCLAHSEARHGKDTLEAIGPRLQEIAGLAGKICQGRRQSPDGRIARTHLDPFPAKIVGLLEPGSQAGADQRGLAGAGAPHDSNERCVPDLR